MTAYVIDERGRIHVLKTRRRSNVFEAVCDLLERIAEPIEIRRYGAARDVSALLNGRTVINY